MIDAREACPRQVLPSSRWHARANRNRQHVVKATPVAQFHRDASRPGVVGQSADELLQLQGIDTHSPPVLEALAQRTVEIERGDRLLRAGRFALLPYPAHIVHMPLSLPPCEANVKQTSAFATDYQAFNQGIHSIVGSSFHSVHNQ